MEKRADQFKKQLASIDLSKVNAESLQKWLCDWSNYISSGGTRPKKPH